jgi:hypothetical protein
VCLLRGTDWVFMCFVWIWEQTAIISLRKINLFFSYKSAFKRAVSLLPLMAEARVRFQASPFDIPAVARGTVSFHHWWTLVFVYVWSYQKDKRAKSGNRPKSYAVSEIVEHWIDKNIHLFLKG